MLISAARHLNCLIVAVLPTLAITGATATAQSTPADLRGILQAVAAIRDGQGKVAGGPWHITAGAAAAIELARAANIPHRLKNSSGTTRCVDGYDATVDVQSGGPNAARVIVGIRCLNEPGSVFKTYYFERYYGVVRIGDKWIARFEGFSITMRGQLLPKFAFQPDPEPPLSYPA